MQNDPSYELRQAIYNAINKKTVYGGKTYQADLYSKLKVPDYYVKIGYPRMVENMDTQDSYIMDGQISIEVVNRNFTQQHSAEAEMVDIVNDINSNVVYKDLSMTGFEFVVFPYVTGYETFETLFQDQPIATEIKKIITYKFSIQQS